MIKHLFCDLDGTLIVNHTVSEEDKEAIRHFVQSGGQFHIITGRTLAEINQFILQEDIPVQYCIGNNGCEIVKDGKMLLKEEIDSSVLNTLKSQLEPFAKRANFFEITSNGNVYYADEVKSKKFIQYKDDNLIVEPNLFQMNFAKQGLTKMYMEADCEVVADFLEMLDENFADSISHYGEITNVNVGPKDVSKGSALKFLETHFDLQDFAVIGDGANDIPMFEVTEHSFSFHRAHSMVTKHANHHVESVAEAIAYLMK
ncbi:MAG: HAD-IIB family hydrolase [Culicoidibacterales bacterium]